MRDIAHPQRDRRGRLRRGRRRRPRRGCAQAAAAARHRAPKEVTEDDLATILAGRWSSGEQTRADQVAAALRRAGIARRGRLGARPGALLLATPRSTACRRRSWSGRGTSTSSTRSSRCRASEGPADHARRRHVDRRQRRSAPGIVVDTTPAPQPGSTRRPRGADGDRRARRRARRPADAAAPAPGCGSARTRPPTPAARSAG